VLEGVPDQLREADAVDPGLRRGDVILEIDRKTIANTGEFQKAVDQVKPGTNILFLISRGGNNLFLALKSPGAQG
jgi:S1-C subfamily serine protease